MKILSYHEVQKRYKKKTIEQYVCYNSTSFTNQRASLSSCPPDAQKN